MARADGIKPPQTGSEPAILSLNEARSNLAHPVRFERTSYWLTANRSAKVELEVNDLAGREQG